MTDEELSTDTEKSKSTSAEDSSHQDLEESPQQTLQSEPSRQSAPDESIQANGKPFPDVTGSETDSNSVQPVELLVNLAEAGEIDPWNIDVVVVTDKFLEHLDEGDLKTSGRALFYASVLLRMKGDALLNPDEAEEDQQQPAEPVPGMATGVGDPIEQLEAEMDRRLERKRVRGSPETLEDLVRQLRDAERRIWWKEAREYDTTGSPSGYARGTQTLDYHATDAARAGGEPTEAEVTGTAHAEDMEAVVEDVHAALRDQYEKDRTEVLYTEIESAGGSRIMTYLGLLFLANRGRIVLQQDELFGDLWIRNAEDREIPATPA